MSKDRETNFGMENIPEEILQKIFSNLKVVDYIRCSLTCKRFRATCHDKLTWQKISSKLKVCLTFFVYFVRFLKLSVFFCYNSQ